MGKYDDPRSVDGGGDPDGYPRKFEARVSHENLRNIALCPSKRRS